MATDDRITAALAATDLFRSLDRKSLKRVADTASVVNHPAGKEVAAQGKSGVGFHLILDGEATVEVGGTQRRTLGPGEYFGEISLIDGKARSATVRATTDLSTASLVTWDFRPLLDTVPGLARELLLVMCARLRAAEAATVAD